MSYCEYTPSPALAPYVECFWAARSDAPQAAPAREVLLPDGTTQLLLSLGGSYRRFTSPEGALGERITGSHLVGLRTSGVFIEQDEPEDVFAIRFRAGGLSPFLSLPASEVAHRSVALDLLLGEFGDELEGRVFAASTAEQRVRVAESALLTRLRAGRLPEPYVARAIRAIYGTRGTVPVGYLGERLGVSPRTLDRGFLRHVGIPPKRLCRIVRFNHALSRMLRTGEESHSRIAHAAGYADQAHLIRDFREFTQSTPLEFLARRYGIVEVSRPAVEKRLSDSFNTGS